MNTRTRILVLFDNNGAEYVSVSMSAPEFGTIYGNVANAPGDDPMKKVIIWNPPA